MRISRFYFIFNVVFVFLFALLDWLLMFESSPLHSCFLNHVDLPNIWRRIHTGPYIIGMIVSGNFHQASAAGYLVAAALQWLVVGFLRSLVAFDIVIGQH